MHKAWVGVVLVCCTFFGSTARCAASLDPLDELTAPVALYPDALLAQVLACATSPGQVTEMYAWLQQNKQLHGTSLQEAAEQRGYDASFVALVLFPDVVQQLASQIGWTTELGTAFLSDPKGVMSAVQKLRVQAQAAGNLKSTSQQLVTTENPNGLPVILIQPANPQVVYVPVYNPQTVYYPPPSGAAVLVGFGLGIAIGAAMTNNAYYSPYGWGAWGMHWHSHTVVVRGGVWVVPPHARYPYVRPIPMPYGGYRPRPYVYAQATVNITKVNINAPGYAGGAAARPKPYAPVARPSLMPAAANPAKTPPSRPTSGSNIRPATPPTMPVQRPAGSAPGKADYGSRGYNSAATARPSDRAQTTSSAFTGYQSGAAERAASQRGQGSLSRAPSRAGTKR